VRRGCESETTFFVKEKTRRKVPRRVSPNRFFDQAPLAGLRTTLNRES
jgi:hypothetical protein